MCCFWIFTILLMQVKSSALARNHKDGKAAVMIQKVWRRILGLKRVMTKRAMDAAAKDSMESVNPRNLFAMDVKELAKRIQDALYQPLATPLPPDEVLHMLRMTCSLLIASDKYTGHTTYSNVGARYFKEVAESDLGWEETMKMVNRSNRFLRRIRAMAYAPVAKPPRLIYVPESVHTLYRAMVYNPKWKIETFEMMGRGSKLCVQLFKWLNSIVTLSVSQSKFMQFIGDKFPEWLPKLFDIQKTARHQELDISINETTISILQSNIEASSDDFNLGNVIAKEISDLNKDMKLYVKNLRIAVGEEQALGANQESLEHMALQKAEMNLKIVEDKLKAAMMEYDNLVKSTQDGDSLAEINLPESRAKLITQQVEVKEARTQHRLMINQCDNNKHHRKERKPLSVEVLKQCSIAGESKALWIMQSVKKKLLLMSRGIKSEDALHLFPAVVSIYKELTDVEQEKKTEFRNHYKNAESELYAMEAAIQAEIVEREEQEKSEQSQYMPTEAELQEERIEDDNEAKSERFVRIQYVPHSVLYNAPVRQRPVIIAFSRDVPAYSKEKIITEITSLLPGIFVRMDVPKNMGIDLAEMQFILDAGKSIMLSVDHGLTKVTRSNFIKNYNVATKCLVPQPYSVFVLGEDNNRKSVKGNPRFGVSAVDITRMRDADIKICLETMAWILDEFLTPDIRKRMESRASLIVPPSPSFLVVLEALFIAQSTHTRFLQPDKNVAAVSWRATQSLLQDPYNLVNQLRSVKRGKADFKLCDILVNYVNHRSWPSESHPERKSDPLLHILALFLEKWVESERLTLIGGGPPDAGLFKTSLERVQTVLSVGDALDEDDNLQAVKRSGWKTPVTQILKGCLYEMRTVKTVRKIDNVMYSINCYREAGRIFFDAYDSNTSQSYVTSISVNEIPYLIIPQALSAEKKIEIAPPTTPKDMYMRLIKLLRFQKTMKLKGGRKELLCRRENVYLSCVTRRFSGHLIVIRAYEAALGELYFEAYLSDFCAKVSFLVEDELRLKLLKNCDGKLEYHIIESDKAVDVLPYILDRLRITPSLNLSSIRNNKQSPNAALAVSKVNQGFKLRLRCRGGAGKLLTKVSLMFAGVFHLLSIKVSTVSQTMRLIAYEPRTQDTSELRLNAFERQLLLGAVNDDCKSWVNTLKSKLKIIWRGKRELSIDKTVYKSVKRICGRKSIISFSLIDFDNIKVTIFDPIYSQSFSSTLSKKDIIDLLNFETNEEKERNDNTTGKVSDIIVSLKNVLRYMLNGRDKTASHSGSTADPASYDLSLEKILNNKDCNILLANQLETLLVLQDNHNAKMGYIIRVPIEIKFDLEPILTNVEMNTKLRHTPSLVSKIRSGSSDDVVEGRKQAPIILMDDELDKLAESLAEAARLKTLADKQAAKELHIQLTVFNKNEEVSLDNDILSGAAQIAASDIVQSIALNIEDRDIDRRVERAVPGTKQQQYLEKKASLIPVIIPPETIVDRDIKIGDEVLVFKRGVKVTFREGKSRWHGHVGVSVYQSTCWDGPDGVGRRFHFVVYEPGAARTFEGYISATKHLREILGINGQDLIERNKATEMLIFISRTRLLMVRNTTTWDGEPVTDLDAPAYRVEFISDTLYSVAKVTPITANADDDGTHNGKKLIDEGTLQLNVIKTLTNFIDIEKSRGKKLLRLARRVSGLLLQLVVFELPKSVEQIKKEEAAKVAAIVAAEGNEEVADVKIISDKKARQKVVSREAPSLRILGYDPRSKQRSIIIASPAAVCEVAGGEYSAYLEIERRRELARVVCESLQLFFPRGGGFELVVPWSQSAAVASGVIIGAKNSWRASAEKVLQRPGRIYRSGVRISALDIIVSVFMNSTKEGDRENDKSVIFNFYSQAASESTEILLDEGKQIEYMGRTILNYVPGDTRSVAIRNMSKYFSAILDEDPRDHTKKVLIVDLLPKKKGYIPDYKQIGLPIPGTDVRASGVPTVFMPPDATGALLYRKSNRIFVKEENSLSTVEYVVSVHSRTKNEGPERGIVIKVYDTEISQTLVLHISPSEVQRMLAAADQAEVLKQLVSAKELLSDEKHDALEEGFVDLTEKGESLARINKLTEVLCDIAIKDIGLTLNSQGEKCLYSIGSTYLPT